MTLLIRNVQILGGSRPFSDACDVFVSDDKISAIGNFPNKKADVVLEGQGAYLSPGFIDVNTDSDHYLTLFDHPAQEDFLRQGVTTIFGGMCGSSLAPLLYGSLESFEKWGETNRVNVNWHTMAEFLKAFDRRPLAVNFGTLVGHATVRRAIVDDAVRDLTKNELRVLVETVKKAVREGGFGLSAGLAYIHERSTPQSELKVLVDMIAGEKGVYAVHLRNTDAGIAASVEETINLAKAAKAKTLVSHFVPHLGNEKEYTLALAAIDALPPEIDLRFDIYPSASTLLPLYTFLPLWAQYGGVEVMLAKVKDAWLATKVKKDMPKIDEEKFVIAWAPENDFLVGKTLAEMRQIYGVNDAKDALIQLMVTMNMRGGVLYRNLADQVSKQAMKSKRSFIASNAPSFDQPPFRGKKLKSERTTRTFVDFLRIVEEERILPLEEAIAKLTAEPAKMFGLPLRGIIEEGAFADLVCFKGNEIKFTVVNGKLAMQDGEFKGTFSGKALRHGARS